jgi:uncharacterized membrane protein YjjB (DUF3815 family)
MTADWTNILFKAFWCGWAAVGFGILFNVPLKTLWAIWIGGAIAGCVKFSVLSLLGNSPVILSSFFAALSAGIFSSAIGFSRHEPPKIFAIPSVIPLVPGVFAYHTMMGLIKLTGKIGPDYTTILTETVNNGVTTLFIIMVIALGVTIPIHLMRRNIPGKFQLEQ